MEWFRKNKLIVALAIIKFLLPFILTNGIWELHRDEYLYYEQGKHLALGYLENPPLLGLLAYISSLLGGSVFFIKFWPGLFGAVTIIVAAAIAKELGGKVYAQFIAGFGIVFSAYLRIHFLFQPNFLEIFFWTLSAYYLLRFISTQQNKYLYFLSITLALSLWSKYSALFLIAAIIIGLLFTKHRRVLANKHFWLALLVGFVLIAPNILWQYYHKFPLVHHMNELRETQLQYLNKADFIKEQLLFLFPMAFVWIGGLIWLLSDSRYRIIAYMYFIILILLIAGKGKGYYTLGAYPMLLAAGGVWLENIIIKKIWIRYAALIFITVLSLPFIPILLPMQTPKAMAAFNQKYNLKKIGVLRWEDQENHLLQQDFADMLGWKELTQKAEKFYYSLPPEEQKYCVIYCRNYGQTGALKYYSKEDDFRKKVFGDNGTFLLWISPQIDFKHLLFIGRNVPEKDDEVFNHFEKVTIIDSVSNPLSRQHGDKIIYFQNADSLAASLARKDIAEMRSEFER